MVGEGKSLHHLLFAHLLKREHKTTREFIDHTFLPAITSTIAGRNDHKYEQHTDGSSILDSSLGIAVHCSIRFSLILRGLFLVSLNIVVIPVVPPSFVVVHQERSLDRSHDLDSSVELHAD